MREAALHQLNSRWARNRRAEDERGWSRLQLLAVLEEGVDAAAVGRHRKQKHAGDGLRCVVSKEVELDAVVESIGVLFSRTLMLVHGGFGSDDGVAVGGKRRVALEQLCARRAEHPLVNE